MRLWSTPPAAKMKVVQDDPEGGTLELTLALSERVYGGAQTAFGGAFAAFGGRFLRLPLPPTLRLIPVAMVAIGAGIGAVGAAVATAEYRILFRRGKGADFRWRLGPLTRHIEIAPSDFAGLEVTKELRNGGSEQPWDHGTTVHVLQLVTKGGQAYPVEEFITRIQADLRKKQIEAVIA